MGFEPLNSDKLRVFFLEGLERRMQFTMLRDSDDEFLSALQSLKSQETDLIRKPEARHTLDQKECIVPFRVSPRASCNLVLCITVLNAHFILSTFTPHRVSHASNCALSRKLCSVLPGQTSRAEKWAPMDPRTNRYRHSWAWDGIRACRRMGPLSVRWRGTEQCRPVASSCRHHSLLALYRHLPP